MDNGRAFFAALLFASSTWATWATAAVARAAPISLDKEAALARLHTIGTRIEAARVAAREGTPEAAARVDALLVEAAQATMDLQNAVLEAPAAAPAPSDGAAPGSASPAPAAGPPVLGVSAFTVLLGTMLREPFDTDKERILHESLGPAALLSSQALRFIATFKFSDARMAVLKFLAPHLVDRPTRLQLNQLFSLIGEQERARKILTDLDERD